MRWRWVVLATAIGVLLFAATAITQGACYDSSDPAASYCTSGTLLPAAVAPFAWAGYLVLAAFLVHRAARPGRRDGRRRELAEP